MRTIDDRTTLDRTVRIYDSFYSTSLVVSTDQYDPVHSFFRGVCSTKNIADNFTVVLFRIAQQTGIDAMTLLAELKGNNNNNKLQMNQVMCYYMNSLKSKTSLYGIGTVPKPVVPIARNIVQ